MQFKPLLYHLNNQNPNIQLFGHFYLVFKWSVYFIRPTIKILDILHHKTDIFCPVLRPPFEKQTIQQLEMFGPFEYYGKYMLPHVNKDRS